MFRLLLSEGVFEELLSVHGHAWVKMVRSLLLLLSLQCVIRQLNFIYAKGCSVIPSHLLEGRGEKIKTNYDFFEGSQTSIGSKF